MSYKYNHVALGGTFDLLHKGHISLLEKAFKSGKFVSIGITCDKFCKQSGKNPYESQSERRKNLHAYAAKKGWSKRSKIVWLDDIYGTTIKDKTLEAIVVSKETVQGATEINKKRQKLKLKKLKVIICPPVLADDGKKISTGRIRSGEISPEGINYAQHLKKIAGIRFNDQIRENLKKPFGEIVNINKKIKLLRPLISVGDITTQNLLKNKVIPDISVVDFFVNRKRIFQNLLQLGFAQPNPNYIVQNVPGQISTELVLTIQKALQNQSLGQIILVNGEEDLAFIPTLLLAPLGTTILYGQPNRGAVIVTVTPLAKSRLCTLLNLKKYS